MSTAEITAYLFGAELDSRRVPILGMFTVSRHRLEGVLAPAVWDSRERLGGDSWAYWVRRGYEEHQACRG